MWLFLPVLPLYSLLLLHGLIASAEAIVLPLYWLTSVNQTPMLFVVRQAAVRRESMSVDRIISLGSAARKDALFRFCFTVYLDLASFLSTDTLTRCKHPDGRSGE